MSETEQPEHKNWICTICEKPLHTPVVSECGHIFCWPCICKHLENYSKCPVCHKDLDKEKLVPIYGQTNESTENAPPPPKAQRIPPKEQPRFGNGGNFGQFQFGFLPFGFGFAFGGNFGNGNINFMNNLNQMRMPNQPNPPNNRPNRNVHLLIFFILPLLFFILNIILLQF